MARLKEKISESLSSVLPITAIVFLLCITIAPVTNNILMMFYFNLFQLVSLFMIVHLQA